ncbi:HAD domain-containing protein [Nostoc sp. NIES-2111]
MSQGALPSTASVTPNGSGTVFLDIDGVLCIGKPTACLDLSQKLRQGEPLSGRELETIFSPVARNALAVVHRRARVARYVISSSWRELFSREGMASILVAAGMSYVADNLAEGDSWKCGPKGDFREREAEILNWLTTYHQGEPFVVLDDEYSAGRLNFIHHFPDDILFGRIALCKPGLGLTLDLVEGIVAALGRPCTAVGEAACDPP